MAQVCSTAKVRPSLKHRVLSQTGCYVPSTAHSDPALQKGWADMSTRQMLHAVCAGSVTRLCCVQEHGDRGLASSLTGHEPGVMVRSPVVW